MSSVTSSTKIIAMARSTGVFRTSQEPPASIAETRVSTRARVRYTVATGNVPCTHRRAVQTMHQGREAVHTRRRAFGTCGNCTAILLRTGITVRAVRPTAGAYQSVMVVRRGCYNARCGGPRLYWGLTEVVGE